MIERIQKIIASRGIASRRKAEELITAGRVTCNGRICLLGESADPDVDVILLDGKPLPSSIEPTYIMLHKPRGYVTTLSDDKGRRDVTQLISGCGTRVYPVGRLDMDSEGLLILTNDGEFANRLMHPKHKINKTYRVMVTGFTQEALKRLRRPVTLDGYTIAEPSVRLIQRNADGSAELEVIIHEGRYRQVRRMCDMAGMTVQRLIRIAEGNLQLGNLPSGRWRELTQEELAQLQD